MAAEPRPIPIARAKQRATHTGTVRMAHLGHTPNHHNRPHPMTKATRKSMRTAIDVDSGTNNRGKNTLETRAWLLTSEPDARLTVEAKTVHSRVPTKPNRK